MVYVVRYYTYAAAYQRTGDILGRGCTVDDGRKASLHFQWDRQRQCQDVERRTANSTQIINCQPLKEEKITKFNFYTLEVTKNEIY